MKKPLETINRGTLFLLCMPGAMQGFMHTPAASMIQGIYAKHAGVALAALGTAVLITRIFDAITDPMIGIMSDAWYRKRGTRKHFVVVGTAITMVGLWFLFRPPEEVGIIYFTVWFLVTYLGWTVTEIPFRAWTLELTSEHKLRTRIQTWLGVAALLGTYSFYFIPVTTQALGLTESNELNLDTLRYAAFVIIGIMPIVNLLAVWRVPNGEHHEEQPIIKGKELWTAVRMNGPLVYLVLITLFSNLMAGLTQGTSYLYIDTYLGLSEEHAGLLMLAMPVMVIAVPFWGFMCQKFERHKVWAIAIACGGIIYTAYGFIPPGSENAGLVAASMMGALFFAACAVPASLPMFGDVMDYGRWKFGHDFGGMYMSFYSLIQKTIVGAGLAISLIVLGWFGFDAAASEQTATGAFGIRFTAALLPGISMTLVAPFIWFFPITRAKHENMMADIRARDAAMAKAEA